MLRKEKKNKNTLHSLSTTLNALFGSMYTHVQEKRKKGNSSMYISTPHL